MAKRLPQLQLEQDMEWTGVITRYSDGRTVSRFIGSDNETIGRHLSSLAKNLGYDYEQHRLIQLSDQLTLKKDIRLLVSLILQLLK